MIIWGTRGVTSTAEVRQFFCPRCSGPQTCNIKQVRTFFTLYFIPIIPLNVAGRYVECGACGGAYEEDILLYDPEQERIETQTHLLRVMVLAALADGDINDGERAEIQKQFYELAGTHVAPATLEQEIALAFSSGADLNSFAATIAHHLSPEGKGLVVQLAFQTMWASGDLAPSHQDQLKRLGATLGIPNDDYMNLLQQLNDFVNQK